MKYIAFAFVVCVTVAVCAGADFDGKCTPGESFKVNCNDCVCPESGNAALAGCTKKGCAGYFCKDDCTWSDGITTCFCYKGQQYCFSRKAIRNEFP